MKPGAIPAQIDVSPEPEPAVRIEVVSSSTEVVEVGLERISTVRGAGGMSGRTHWEHWGGSSSSVLQGRRLGVGDVQACWRCSFFG